MGEMIGLTFFSYIGMAIAAVTSMVGIGLLFRVEQARGIVNFLCGLQIIFGLSAWREPFWDRCFLDRLGW